jgi:integrase
LAKATWTHAYRRNQPVEEYVTNNFALDRKLKEAFSDLKPSIQCSILKFSDEDKELIADFIADYFNQNGTAMSPNTKRGYVDALHLLSQYVMESRNGGIYKPFRELTHEDFFADHQKPYGYLRSLKKTFEQDPHERWVNTYDTRLTKYLAFWKYLTQPELKREERQDPPQLKGYRWILHKSPDNRTRVRREYHWTDEEHKAFLKYCIDKRLVCFHAMHRDVGGRPSELLALKISDIKFKVSSTSGKKYAEFRIGDKINGKMKQARLATISDSIPYYNIWRAVHPRSDDNPENAYLFPSHSTKAKYRNEPLTADSLRLAYARTIEEHFPKLLLRPDISLEDKAVLKSLINDKPHYPYIRRHEFATENIKGIDLDSFKRLMGHSKNSRMWEAYVHSKDTDGVTELNIKRGVITREEFKSSARLELEPKYCPVCKEVNKRDADFCFSCNWVLSIKGMQDVREQDEAAARKAEEKEKELEQLRQEQRKVMEVIKLMDAKMRQINNYLRATNAELRETNAEMEKNFTKEQIEQIDKELQEEDEQAATYGIDLNELLLRSSRELRSSTRKT